jgi:hypothetical protein
MKKGAILLLALSTVFVMLPAWGQSTVSGDITGVVSDPSGAILPNAKVTLKNQQTGGTQTANSNGAGVYRFSLLTPGSYSVTAEMQGFQGAAKNVNVSVGEATTADIQLAVAQQNQTVEVYAEGGVVETQNANVSTNFSNEQVQNVPNPGNDLSYVVQTAPGAVMNTQAGYGNSSTFGLPATSNLFTVNGQNENDPFFNTLNSGATNLTLGRNDVQEVTVVNNGYTGQYGGLAGANVNYVTKSGSNAWHGNAEYYWNGRAMNANNYFNVGAGVPRPFVNANQWAASVGGPIRKDKTFFFVDYEGLRVILPTNTNVNIPSPEFQAATLANLSTVSPASIPFYQNMFNLYNTAEGAQGAQNVLSPGTDASGGVISGPGCGSFTGLGLGVPCALQFRSTAGNFTHEYMVTGRLDQNLGQRDRLFMHFRTDHGVQASYTDPINPVFNAVSTQPQYEGQLNETHTFGSTSVNQFVASGSWYSAVFAPPDLGAALAVMPFRVSLAGGAFYSLGRDLNLWPQGRNVTQYQILDDFSMQKGNHNLKFGANFRRNNITDYDPGLGSVGYSVAASLTNFFNGAGGTYIQNFPTRPTQPIALYSLGLYAQDEWAVRSNLRLTISLRAEHNSNPVCQTNCFARLSSSFLDVSHDPNQPYNAAIQTGLHQAVPNITNIIWEPRIGFAWSPHGAGTDMVIRGGFGIFGDILPGTVVDNFMNNSPLNNQFSVSSAPLSPDVSGNQAALAAQANTLFVNGFNSGQTLAEIQANPNGGQFFVPPNFYNAARSLENPQYQEWNLEFQKGIGQKMTLSLNYVGNHGIYEAVQNAGYNGYCDLGCLGLLSPTGVPTSASFAGLPSTALDPRFGTVTEVQSAGVSNYNGLTVSFSRRFSAVQLQANYTWSHALDEISNAGFLQYNFQTNESTLNPQDPYNLKRYNYGNADYDTRHYFSLNYVWDTPKISGWKGFLSAWTVSGTIFARSGLPFTVVDSNASGILNSYNLGTTAGPNIFANQIGPTPISCSSDAVNTPCFSTTSFSPATTGFGQQRRNQVYGPNYFNTDLSVMKTVKVPHWEGARFAAGVQFFNLFNHPNFDQPFADVASPSQLGVILSTVNTPTSVLGSFLGGDASPRLIQLKASFQF